MWAAVSDVNVYFNPGTPFGLGSAPASPGSPVALAKAAGAGDPESFRGSRTFRKGSKGERFGEGVETSICRASAAGDVRD